MVKILEAGRVLNGKNEARLRAILRALKDVFTNAGIPEDEPEQTDDDKTTAKEAGGFSISDLGVLLQSALDGLYVPTTDSEYRYSKAPQLVDVFDDTLVYREGWAGSFFQVGYTVDETGVVTLGVPALVVRKVQYIQPGGNSGEQVEAAEAGELHTPEAQIIPLLEAALAGDNTGRVKIIAPGWGSSGYYPADVLKRDGPKIFTAGTKMFWDHQTAAEEAAQPEGSLARLAGVLETDAEYRNDPKHGEGLYAKIKAFEGFAPAINDLAPHIGTSIRAAGRAVMGEAEGKRGPIIKELTAAKSVDFVTIPGAGGKVLQLFESAATRTPVITSDEEGVFEMTPEQIAALIEKSVREAVAPLASQNAQLREAINLREARGAVERILADTRYDPVPVAAKERIAQKAAAQFTLNEAGAIDMVKLTESAQAVIDAEINYLVEAGAGHLGVVRGMGSAGDTEGSPAAKGTNIEDELNETFRGWGLSEGAAKVAAAGRMNLRG
jgi:hypothetical protein